MARWRDAVIRGYESIENAAALLERTSLRIIFVVAEDSRLIGTVTDGDIRRGILNHLSLKEPVSSVMNQNPISLRENETKETVLKVMREQDILQIPLLNGDGQIAKVEFLQELSRKPSHPNSVVIMAGGMGSRLRPLTDTVPKPMLRIGNMPMIARIVGQLVNAGFTKLFLSIGYRGEVIRDYFGDGSAWDADIRYLEEDEPRGTAGALTLLPKSDQEYPLLVMNGDILTMVDYQQLIGFHNDSGSEITVCIREFEWEIPYGVVQIQGDQFVGMEEKPIQKYFVNAGIYILSPSAIPGCMSSQRLDMPDLIHLRLEKKRKISVFPIHEYWLDIGAIESLEKAQADVKMFPR